MTKLQMNAITLNAMFKGEYYLTDMNDLSATFEKRGKRTTLKINVCENMITIIKETSKEIIELSSFSISLFSELSSIDIMDLKFEILEEIKNCK